VLLDARRHAANFFAWEAGGYKELGGQTRSPLSMLRPAGRVAYIMQQRGGVHHLGIRSNRCCDTNRQVANPKSVPGIVPRRLLGQVSTHCLL
jgi:hypothetical protein